QFARGGIAATGGVLKGRSHAQGGIPFTVGGRPGFEAEGGEAIINKRSTQMFRPLLSRINEAGGGVAFERGGPLYSTPVKYQTGNLISTEASRIADEGSRIEAIVKNTIQNMPPILVTVEDIKERMGEYDSGVNN